MTSVGQRWRVWTTVSQVTEEQPCQVNKRNIFTSFWTRIDNIFNLNQINYQYNTVYSLKQGFSRNGMPYLYTIWYTQHYAYTICLVLHVPGMDIYQRLLT